MTTTINFNTTGTERWQQRYQEAHDFCTTHNRVPKQRECAAGKWLAKQREKARAGSLSDECLQLLNELPGFAVDQRGKNHEEHLTAVIKFARRRGRLPRSTDTGMHAHAQWIKDIRAGKVTLTPAHQHMLDQAGYAATPTVDRRQEFLDHYRAYVTETGSRWVPARYVCEDGYPLGSRCSIRRDADRRDELSMAHRAQLDAIQFPWDLAQA